MACRLIAIPMADGTVAHGIVCGVREKRRVCVGCGRRAERLCDWKLSGKRTGRTCNRAVCTSCSTSPAPDKDLCPSHAAMWSKHPSNPANKETSRCPTEP